MPKSLWFILWTGLLACDRKTGGLLMPEAGAQTAKDTAIPEEKSSYKILRPPADMAIQNVAGLKLELEARDVKDAAGFFVNFYAARQLEGTPSTEREIELGQTSVFKPMKEGERMTVYLAAPAKEAWINDANGPLLRVRFELLPARPELDPPRIRLQWATATMEGQAPGK
jgi:hypothetical protein